MLMPHTLNRKPKGVLHLGANTGEEADLYDQAGSVQRVVWFECNPAILPFLHMNVDGRFSPQHYVVEAAVADEDGKELNFHITNNNASSSLLELGEHSIQYPDIVETKILPVKTRTVDSVLTEMGWKDEWFDFANLDLQGGELLALHGMQRVLKHLRWVYTEVNFKELYKGCPLVDDITNFLANFGFKQICMADTGCGWGDACYEKP